MTEMIKDNSPRSKERLVSSQLKAVFEEQGVSTEGGTVALATGGPPICTTLGQVKLKPAPKFSSESLLRLQLKIRASDNKMNSLGNFLRINCGRDSVRNLKTDMSERNKKLVDHFECKNMLQTEYVTKEEDANEKTT